MMGIPLSPLTPAQLQAKLDLLTKQRNQLIEKRESIVERAKQSSKYIELSKRYNKVKSAYNKTSERAESARLAVWDRFLERRDDHQSCSPYYSKSTSTWSHGHTNIHSDVLKAISTVAPLSSLTEENIKDTVRNLMHIAVSEDQHIEKLNADAKLLSVESAVMQKQLYDIEHPHAIEPLTRQICSLYTEIHTLTDQLAHPAKHKLRDKVSRNRFAVETGLERIYAEFKRLESRVTA